MINSILKEIELRKNEIKEPVETIYFGGGTPSILSLAEIDALINSIYKHFSVIPNPEITLEANPDDLREKKVFEIKSTPINRFSVGIQSFFDEDLRLMNRAHTAEESLKSIKLIQENGFENITIDLIYGGQTTTDEMWRKNLEIAIDLNVPHISSYALTVEAKTILAHQIETKKLEEIDENIQERQFQMLAKTLTENGFIHYEISNFGKKGFLSQHNSNYWKGKPYLGLGPSAHSFDGVNRNWNVANNAIYIKKLTQNQLANEVELLNDNERFNELIMIRLRTVYGLSVNEIKDQFPSEFLKDFLSEIQLHLENKTVEYKNETYYLTEKGKFLADGIAASLFRV